MPMPKSVIRNNKDGFVFTDNVDRVNYTIEELMRGAYRDMAKRLNYKFRQNWYKSHRKLSGRVQKASSFSYWARKREKDLLIGQNPAAKAGKRIPGFYFAFQETGTSNQKEERIMWHTVNEEIDNLYAIGAKYLSALDDEARAERLIADKVVDEVIDE